MSTLALAQPAYTLDSRNQARFLRPLLFLWVATVGFVSFEPTPFDLAFPLVLIFCLLAGHLAAAQRFRPGLLLSMGVLAFFNAVSMLFAHSLRGAAYYVSVTYYLLVLFLFLAALIGRYGPSLAGLILEGFKLAAIVAASIGILARFQLLPASEMFMREGAGVRVRSTFKDPNVFAPFLVAAVILALSSMVERKRFRLRDVGITVLLCIGILFAFSRGAYVHLAVSLAVYLALQLLVLRHAQTLKRLFVGGVITLSIGVPAGVTVLTQSDLGDFFVRRLTVQDYDQERFGSQAMAFRIASENVLGLGPGQWNSARFQRSTHNLYLRVLAENGLFGLLALLAFLAITLHEAWRGVARRGPHASLYAVCLAVTLGILVESVVIDTLHWRHFFLFLAIPIGLAMYEREHATIPQHAS